MASSCIERTRPTERGKNAGPGPAARRSISDVFIRSEDQQLFEETTKRFLEAECPLDRMRELATLPDGYDPSVWQRGAELGWTSLVVPEESGGGSVSEQGVLDLALVAYQFGLHAAPGPLLGSNVVAAAIGRWGSCAQRAGPLHELLIGHATGRVGDADRRRTDALGSRCGHRDRGRLRVGGDHVPRRGRVGRLVLPGDGPKPGPG